MTPRQFRTAALALPEAIEGSHQGHADFRVRKKVFATLGPEEDWGMVKLPTELQERLIETEPTVFEMVPGAWGRQGCTRVWLKKAPLATVRAALTEAWRKTAPKTLVAAFDEDRL